MPRTITISLPVVDLKASKAFYTALGFVDNPQFSGDGGVFMVWSETINIVLLTYEKWRTFTTRPIPRKLRVKLHLISRVNHVKRLMQ